MKALLAVLLSVFLIGGVTRVASAYINPNATALGQQLSDDATDLHDYLHTAWPGTLSGFAAHDYDNAADDLRKTLLFWSLNAATEADVKQDLAALNNTWQTMKLILRLEGLKPQDPVLTAKVKKCREEHLLLETMITGMHPTK
jgi:hypothetical protein